MHSENEKREKETHNFQFHRKEINVYRRIDCGTAPTRKIYETQTENGFQHAAARFDQFDGKNLTNHAYQHKHTHAGARSRDAVAVCAVCDADVGLVCALVRHRLSFVRFRIPTFVPFSLFAVDSSPSDFRPKVTFVRGKEPKRAGSRCAHIHERRNHQK